MQLSRSIAAVFVLVISALGPVFGQSSVVTSDPETITIDTAAGPVTYNLDTIKKDFPVRERVTRTPWTKEGELIRYRGVYISDLLTKNDMGEFSAIEVRADDGFQARIPKSDIDSYSPMIAYEKACSDADRQNGTCQAGNEFRTLNVDESGPFFVVWPYDDLPPIYIPARNNLWVWWVISLRSVP